MPMGLSDGRAGVPEVAATHFRGDNAMVGASFEFAWQRNPHPMSNRLQVPPRNQLQAKQFSVRPAFKVSKWSDKPMSKKDTHRAQPAPAVLSDWFAKFANKVAQAAGSPITFSLALAVLIAWAISGPYWDYSEEWQLLVNTGTTIVTFLMVFVIQNSQNRDSLAAQIKLDEIIRAVTGAKNSMIDLECLTDEQLAELRAKFAEIAEEARNDEEAIDEVKDEKVSRRKKWALSKAPGVGNCTLAACGPGWRPANVSGTGFLDG
jgi:low affinity Fe/Cu permease